MCWAAATTGETEEKEGEEGVEGEVEKVDIYRQ